MGSFFAYNMHTIVPAAECSTGYSLCLNLDTGNTAASLPKQAAFLPELALTKL